MNSAASLDLAPDLAEDCIARLKAMEPELRREGIARMSLFGSVARGDATPESDIDLLVVFDPAARMDLIRMIGLERRLGETLGRPVEFMTEPVKNPYLRANVERDRRFVF